MGKKLWRKAKWLFGGVWAVIIASYVIPWASAFVEKRGWIANPDAQVAYFLEALSSLGAFVARPHVAPWLVGAAAAITGGAIGYWARGRLAANAAPPELVNLDRVATNMASLEVPGAPPSAARSESKELSYAERKALAYSELLAAQRDYVTLGVEFLTNLCKRQTSTQVERTIAPYVGKWLNVTARIRDIVPVQEFGYVHVHADEVGSGISVSMVFPIAAFFRLEGLPVDHEIVVNGCIKKIDGRSVSLDPCEIVSDRVPPVTETDS